MGRSHDKTDAPERRLLCGIIFVCYMATLTSLAAFGYSLAALSLSAASHRIDALYLTGGDPPP
jgi:hypothetical protein